MQFSPTIEEEWWDEHVEYAKFNRQRLDISSAVFHHPRPKAIVVLVTGLSDTFLKYSELIRSLYENGFSVYTYDHQSQVLKTIMLYTISALFFALVNEFILTFDKFILYCNRLTLFQTMLNFYLRLYDWDRSFYLSIYLPFTLNSRKLYVFISPGLKVRLPAKIQSQLMYLLLSLAVLSLPLLLPFLLFLVLSLFVLLFHNINY